MDVTINIFWIGGSVILAMIIGYFLGRNEYRGLPVEDKSEETVEGQYRVQKANVQLAAKRHKNEGRCIPQGNPIASPVSGEVHFFCEGGRRGAVIEPEQGKLLLTFDMERLQEAGEELGVTVSLEDALFAAEVTVTQKERVKVGDELLRVKEIKEVSV